MILWGRLTTRAWAFAGPPFSCGAFVAAVLMKVNVKNVEGLQAFLEMVFFLQYLLEVFTLSHRGVAGVALWVEVSKETRYAT